VTIQKAPYNKHNKKCGAFLRLFLVGEEKCAYSSLFYFFLVMTAPFSEGAAGTFGVFSGADASAVVDKPVVQFGPQFFFDKPLEIPFRAQGCAALSQSQPVCHPKHVGIHGNGILSKTAA